MKITKLEIESGILGKEVCQVEEMKDGETFLQEEPTIISKYTPYYIQCQLDAEDLSTIHSMEDAGFRFVEFRLKKMLDIHSFHSVSEYAYYPYYVKTFRDEKNFKIAQQLLAGSTPDDRFTRDPYIADDLARKRLQGYLKKSFDHPDSEFLYGLFNKNREGLLGFKTIEIKNREQVLFCQTALQEELDQQKFTHMLDSLIISQLYEEGYRSFYAVTSGLNLMEMNLHMSVFKYKNVSATVILRKVYV
jgi:hypothetical protein